MNKPLVSVIVPCLNADKLLEKTIKSFTTQKYPHKELLIIDGGSTDQTPKVLKKYATMIDYYKSAPDRGISDAFNKGLVVATGDYIMFMGAGDYFHSPESLSRTMKGVRSGRDILVCGRVERIAPDGKVSYIAGQSFTRTQLLYKMALPHQGLLTHRSFFEKYGDFDLHCRYAMDYELLLRAYRTFPSVLLQPVTLACWRAGGVGASQTRKVIAEYDRIRRKNRVAPPLLLSIINNLTRLRYSLRGE